MKSTIVVLFVIALISLVSASQSSAPALTSSPVGTVTTTTAKPWTQKFKDGLGKFLQGAAIAGAVQQGIHNARSHKHKPSSPASLVPDTKHGH